MCRAFRVAAATAAAADGWGVVVDGGGGGVVGGVAKSLTAMLNATGKAVVVASGDDRLLTAAYADGDRVRGKLPLMLAFLEQVALAVDALQGRCISGESY